MRDIRKCRFLFRCALHGFDGEHEPGDFPDFGPAGAVQTISIWSFCSANVRTSQNATNDIFVDFQAEGQPLVCMRLLQCKMTLMHIGHYCQFTRCSF